MAIVTQEQGGATGRAGDPRTTDGARVPEQARPGGPDDPGTPGIPGAPGRPGDRGTPDGRELLDLREEGVCASVRARMLPLLADRIGDTE
ncbi:hypothetical protein ACWEQL_10330, partial [Kitasatospora sp. NPDC004240]